jgi:hypothetical protein
MTMVGADADRLEAAAAHMRKAADELDAHSAAVGHQLGGLSWLGQLAGAFANLWSSHHKPQLGSTAHFIREAADRLTANAKQQRDASAVSGGAGSRARPSSNTAQAAQTPRAVTSPPSQVAPPAVATSTIEGPQKFTNASIGDVAEREIAQNPAMYRGQNGMNAQGECMVAAARWIKGAGGSWPGGSSPMDAYHSAGAASVAVAAAQRGDVLQKSSSGNPSSWDHVHTMVVLGNNGDGTLRIAESNYDYHGNMRIQERWTPPAPTTDGWGWSAWRFGQV